MYWLVCEVRPATVKKAQSMIISFDIKDSKNIKLLNKTEISKDEFPKYLQIKITQC